VAQPVGTLVLEMAADVARLRSDMRKVERAVTGTMNRVQKSGAVVDGLVRRFRFLGSAIVAAFSINTFRNLLDRAESFKLLEARVKLATSATGDFAEVFAELQRASSRTGASLDSTISFFQSLARSRDSLQTTNKSILQVVESVQKLAAIGGIGGAQLSAGILQLGQAFNSGKLAGDELRSVMENMPALMTLIAKEMGVAVGQLKALGAEGKITSDIILKAVLNSAEDINKEFEQLPLTLSRGINRANNAFDSFIKALLEGEGVLTSIAQLADSIGASIEGWVEFIKPGNLEIRKIDIELTRLKRTQDDLLQALTPNEGKSSGAIMRFLFGNLAPERRAQRLREELGAVFDQIVELNERRQALLAEPERAKALQDEVNAAKELARQQEFAAEKAKAAAKEVRDIAGAGMAREIARLVEEAKKFEKTLEDAVRDARDLNEPLQSIADRIFAIRAAAEHGLLGDEEALKAELKLLKEIGDALDRTSEAAKKLPDNIKKETNKMLVEISSAVDDAARRMEDAFFDFIDGTKTSFKDMVNSILRDIARLVFRKAITEPIAKGISGIIEKIFTRAGGGPVGGGRPYLVGEKGPELFVPNTSGTIVPNSELSGGAINLTIQQNVSAIDGRGVRDALAGEREFIVGIVDEAFHRRGRTGIT
jgi:tape measure domain-containing protein